MTTLELYHGPDRGEFMVHRLDTAQGPVMNANCRIRKATVFNYASQYVYALIGYQIEYWRESEPAPYNGGIATLYQPKDRPNHTTFYMRNKISSTQDMLYLEDGIINDFLNVKLTTPPLNLETYAQAAADQTASIAIPRLIAAKGMEYRNGIHITRYENSPVTPLTLVGQGLKYMAHHAGSALDDTEYTVRDTPFTNLKAMIDTIVLDFTQRFEVQNGGNS